MSANRLLRIDKRAGLLARMVVVEPEDLHAGAAVADDVLLERDVVDLAPRARAVLVARRSGRSRSRTAPPCQL